MLIPRKWVGCLRNGILWTKDEFGYFSLPLPCWDVARTSSRDAGPIPLHVMGLLNGEPINLCDSLPTQSITLQSQQQTVTETE